MKSKEIRIKSPTMFTPGMSEHYENEKPEELSEFSGAKLSVSSALRVMKENYSLLQRAEEVRVANLKDPTNTKIGAMVKTYTFVKDKVRGPLYERTAAAEQGLRDQISEINTRVSRPITKEAESGRFGSEARSHVKSLPVTDRVSFVRQAIDKGDYKTAAYVLGAPAYLSGLEEEDIRLLLDSYQRKRYAKEFRVLDYLEKLADNLGKGFIAASSNLDVVETPEVAKALKLHKAAEEAMS